MGKVGADDANRRQPRIEEEEHRHAQGAGTDRAQAVDRRSDSVNGRPPSIGEVAALARDRCPVGRPVCPVRLHTAAPLRASAGGLRLSARMDVFRAHSRVWCRGLPAYGRSPSSRSTFSGTQHEQSQLSKPRGRPDPPGGPWLTPLARWEPRCPGSGFPRGREVALVSPLLGRNGSARELEVGRVAPAEPASVECRLTSPYPCLR